MLVTPVRLMLGRAREIEVEVCRQSGRPRRTGEDDSEDVRVLVLADQPPEMEELGCGARREPIANVPTRSLRRATASREHVAKLLLEQDDVVREVFTRINSALNAATSIPVASYPDSIACTSVVPGARERIEDVTPGRTYRSRSFSTSWRMNFPRYG
jgi:hypothetical protein